MTTRSGSEIRRFLTLMLTLAVCALGAGHTNAQQSQTEFQPELGQKGKDVIWVPSSPVMIDKMFQMAKLTPRDFLIDLGSGDGRIVIAAAKRGVRALGVEYDPRLVDLSRKTAVRERVGGKASFAQGDMYKADISRATVLALFLLGENLRTLRANFLNLKPGTRIVINTFTIPDWDPDASESVVGDCEEWCTAHLWIVPAKVQGPWQLPQGELRIDQTYQKISGTLSSRTGVTEMANGRLRGDQISFALGDAEYVGRVNGNTIAGTFSAGQRRATWKATRAKHAE